MRQIFEKMHEQMMESLARLGILLTAIRAKALVDDAIAIEASLVLSDGSSRHKENVMIFVG